MQSQNNSWAFLRPVLLAAAAATSWLAISAGAASADTGPSQDSLLGAVGSSLSSASSHATHQVSDVLEPVAAALNGGLAEAPASAVPSLIPAPSVTPVVRDIASLADDVVQSLPVVRTGVPAGTVQAIAEPIAGAADTIVESTVGTVIPVTETVLAPLDPVLAPVTGTVLSPPVTAPQLPDLSDPASAVIPDPVVPELPNPDDQDGTGAAAEALQAPAVAEPSVIAPAAPVIQPGTSTSGLNTGLTVPAHASATADPPSFADPAPGNEPVGPLPSAPVSTTGGAGSSGGSGPTAPGYLSANHFHIPAAVTDAVHGRLLTAPAPVSFDPGSSPD